MLYHAAYPRGLVNSGKVSYLTSDLVMKVVDGLADGSSSKGYARRQEHEMK